MTRDPSLDTRSILETIEDNEWTILVVNRSGSVDAVIGVCSLPTNEMLRHIAEQHTESGFRCLQKGKLTEHDLREIIREIVEALEWAKRHKLRPGANFPGQTPERPEG